MSPIKVPAAFDLRPAVAGHRKEYKWQTFRSSRQITFSDRLGRTAVVVVIIVVIGRSRVRYDDDDDDVDDKKSDRDRFYEGRNQIFFLFLSGKNL